MGFEHIDQQFRGKPKIVLECESCGGTEQVRMAYPLWPTRPPRGKLALCKVCVARSVPLRPEAVG
jgi:hypothetical protein